MCVATGSIVAPRPTGVSTDLLNSRKLTYIIYVPVYVVSFVMTGPDFSDLMQKFKCVVDWESVCPFLINDVDGQKTKQIKKQNDSVDDRHAEMLQEFLRQPHATWRDVVEALKAGKQRTLAAEIEHDIQGEYISMRIHNSCLFSVTQ